jgi:hypothetical protein
VCMNGTAAVGAGAGQLCWATQQGSGNNCIVDWGTAYTIQIKNTGKGAY